jgi:uncharacterized protein
MAKAFLAALIMMTFFALPAPAGEPAESSPYLKATYAKAMKNDPAAQYNLALAYYNGQDVPQDDKLAFKWLQKAAQRGDIQAQTNLGDFYRKGIGVDENDGEAAKWYLQAAGRGKAKAQYSLGVMYQNGSPKIKQNIEESIKWYTRAANQGYPDAQISLGKMHLQGTTGGTPDYEQAYFWFSLAAKGKDEEGAKFSERVAKTLTPEQVAAVDKKVAEWKAVAETEE